MTTLTKVNRIFKTSHFLFIALILFFNQKLKAQEFIIGVEDVYYYPLFEFKTKRETYAKELLNKFAASRGYKFTYLPLPIKRFDKWLLEEKIDFKYPDSSRWYPDPSLKSKYTFSQPTIKLVAGTTVLKSFLKQNTSEFTSLGTLLGFYPTTWIEQIKSGDVKLYEDVSTKILVRQLLEKNVDGIDIEPSVISYYLKELGESSDIVTIDKRFRYDVYAFHFSTIKYPKVIKEFNEFLNTNKTLLSELNRKYNITDYKPYLQ
ncbi:MAG: hypothetical protein HRT54_01175 [Colwellia sp.]|nr:hypothetical protein [Colwellia sp.]